MAPSAIVETVAVVGDAPIPPSKLAAAILETPVQDTNINAPAALLHRSLLERPHNVESACGSYLTLQDGRKILDGCGGAAVAVIGHGNEEVIQATLTQMRKVSYVHTLSYTTDSAEDLADFILNDPESTFQHELTKAYFLGSGSEANDAAMKMARQYFWEKGEVERKWFVVRRQGYHGNTLGAMSISSNVARRVPYEDALTLPTVSFVSPAYAYQYQKASETEEEFCQRLVTEIEEEFLRLGPETIIGFVAEPVVGATSGCVAAPKGSGVSAILSDLLN